MYMRYREAELRHGRLSMLAAVGFPFASTLHNHHLPTYWPLVVLVAGVLEEVMIGDQIWDEILALPAAPNVEKEGDISHSWPSFFSLVVLAVGGSEMALTGFQPMGVTIPWSTMPALLSDEEADTGVSTENMLALAASGCELALTGHQPLGVTIPLHPTVTSPSGDEAGPMLPESLVAIAAGGCELVLTGFQPLGVTIPFSPSTPTPSWDEEAPQQSALFAISASKSTVHTFSEPASFLSDIPSDVLQSTKSWDPAGFSSKASPAKLMYMRYREAELRHGRLSMLAAVGFPFASTLHNHHLPTYWPLVVLVAGVLEEVMIGDQIWDEILALPAAPNVEKEGDISHSWPSFFSLVVLAVGGSEMALTGFQPMGVTIPWSTMPALLSDEEADTGVSTENMLALAASGCELALTGHQPLGVTIPLHPTVTSPSGDEAGPMLPESLVAIAAGGCELVLTGFQPLGVTIPFSPSTPTPSWDEEAPQQSVHQVVGPPPEVFCP